MTLTVITSAIAVIFTVLRAWPQFVHIVKHRHHEGVSLLTWVLGVLNHTLWMMYGFLSPIPLYILVNILAGLGCAAIAYVIGSWREVAGAFVVGVLAGWTLFAVGDGVLLAACIVVSLSMFLPQAIRVFRQGSQGVSATSWAIFAAAAFTWIVFGFSIDRPSVVAPQFVVLPASLVIVARVLLARRTQPQPVAAAVTMVDVAAAEVTTPAPPAPGQLVAPEPNDQAR